jgi:DNA-binding NtrC family response regulator
MARIELRIQNPSNRLVLKTMLEAEGHVAVAETPDVVIADDFSVAGLVDVPLLVLAQAGELVDAVKAMRKGAYGYIVVPFLPGEAGMMVQRALGPHQSTEASADLRTLQQIERDHICAVVRACRHNQSEAAQVLGIARNTLWRKLKSFGDLSQSRRNPE